MASTYIIATGKIVHGGEIEMDVAMPPWVDYNESIELPQDGDLQAVIDYGAEVQELEDARLDEEFWARGQW